MPLQNLTQLGYGFNAQWAYSSDWMEKPLPADNRMLDFMQKYQFNFLRIPIDYRFWLSDIKGEPLESFLKTLDSYVESAISHNIHVSINLHRDPLTVQRVLIWP